MDLHSAVKEAGAGGSFGPREFKANLSKLARLCLRKKRKTEEERSVFLSLPQDSTENDRKPGRKFTRTHHVVEETPNMHSVFFC